MSKVDDKEHELVALKTAKAEREVSNKLYARKEFEKAIIWFVTLVVGAVVIALVSEVIIK
jgi:exosome complex RNA-binding protein Csl4